MFGEIIQFLVIIALFGLFNIIGGKRKRPKSSPKIPDFMGDLQKQLKQFEEDLIGPQPQQPIEQEVVIKKEPTVLVSQPVSAEITEAPYSNLEEGIIDEVHASKFPHHINDLEEFKIKKIKKVNYLKDFDPKRAFVHSLIFERKHFKV